MTCPLCKVQIRETLCCICRLQNYWVEGARGNTSDILCSVVLLELLVNFGFISDTICLLLAHWVLCAFQRRLSLDLHCFSYNFPEQVTFIKVRAGMKGCEMPPLQLLRVHILQKTYKGFVCFALTWKSTLFDFGHLHWESVGTPHPPGAPARPFLPQVWYPQPFSPHYFSKLQGVNRD